MASVLKAATHVFNPLAMPIASSGLIPVWGVIRHRGRKSGRAFATPVALAATRDGFVVPLPWGDRTDWCRNVFAARGGAYAGTAADTQSAYLRNFLGLLGITDIEFVYAEGIAISDASKQAAVTQAKQAIEQLHAAPS